MLTRTASFSASDPNGTRFTVACEPRFNPSSSAWLIPIREMQPIGAQTMNGYFAALALSTCRPSPAPRSVSSGATKFRIAAASPL